MVESPACQSTTPVLPSIGGIFGRSRLNLAKDEIRVLTLHPGIWADPIRCSLRTVQLEDHPHYEALSYAWGDPNDCRRIFLDGRVGRVTANLEAALRRLRHPTQDRQLWVDALCINQADDAEKSHQVNLMSEIYSRTDEGLLWLGDYDEGSLLSDTRNASNPKLEHTPTITRTEAVNAFSFIQLMASGDHMFRRAGIARGLDHLLPERDYHTGLDSLMNLPWWTRIWTAQEAVLPRSATVICGSLQLPFAVLSTASMNFREHRWRECCMLNARNIIAFRFFNTIYTINGIRERDTDLGMVNALMIFRARSASDPRDKIFALLGLISRSNPTRQLSISPDYSLSWRLIYERTTLSLITTTGSLIPLIRVREHDRDPLLPSWVPDWRAITGTEYINSEASWLNFYELFNSSMTAELSLGTCSKSELVVQGIETDRIFTVGRIMGEMVEGLYHNVVAEWKELLEVCLDFQGPYPHGGTYAEAFSRSITFDTIMEASTCRRLNSSDRQANETDWWIGDDDIGTSAYVPANQRFFITQKGLIGLGPAEAAIGDGVYVIRGGRVPFILRLAQRGSRVDWFIYVGHAYVHGIMDGEAVDDPCRWDWLTLV